MKNFSIKVCCLALLFSPVIFCSADGGATFVATGGKEQPLAWSELKFRDPHGTPIPPAMKCSQHDTAILERAVCADSDMQLGTLVLPGRSSFFVDAKKLSAGILRMNFTDSRISLKNGAEMEIRSTLETQSSFRTDAAIKGISIELENSSLKVPIIALNIVSANVSKDTNLPFIFSLKGKSKLTFGDLSLDPLFLQEDSGARFKINIENMKENLPSVESSSDDLSAAELCIKLSDGFPKGTYGILKINSAKSKIKYPKLSVNGADFKKISDKRKVGTKNVSFSSKKTGKKETSLFIILK